jgi:integrase
MGEETMKNGNRKHYGSGLYLQTGGKASASWLLRYQLNGTEHWMGLGSKRAFNAKEARARARKAQQLLYDNVDPLQTKREQARSQALEASRSITFAKAAAQYYTANEKKWSSAGHRRAFLNTLKRYAEPIIGNWAVADVDIPAVLRIVEPIWIEKNKTASRIRGRIEAVLDWATVHGYRAGDNPARWETLGKVLATGGDISAVVHHPALPYADVPPFVAQLSQQPGVPPRAFEMIILCASRTSEVLKARWSEFDFENRIWTIPAPRMKERKEHRVPLTDRMIALLLQALPRESESDDGLVFVGAKQGKPIDKMVLPYLIKAMGFEGMTTTHGFRASFKTWATETTSYPDSMIEFALAHAVGSETERAYMRSDMMEKRRNLMEQWGRFIHTPQRKTGGAVVPIRAV